MFLSARLAVTGIAGCNELRCYLAPGVSEEAEHRLGGIAGAEVIPGTAGPWPTTTPVRRSPSTARSSQRRFPL